MLPGRHRKGRQRRGVDLHRQKAIEEYIVDFFAAEPMLAVEIDGDSHRVKGPENDARQRRPEALGVRFLRFDDAVVKQDLNAVIHAIDRWPKAWEKAKKR